MPRPGKRRAPVHSDDDDEDTTARAGRAQARGGPSAGEAGADGEDEGADTTMQNADGEEEAVDQTGGSDTDTEQQLIKNLVRLALASEYSRTPLRRADISQKVLGDHGRRFQRVFDGAQYTLRQTFGMELVELGAREKVTLRQRIAAAGKSSAAAGAGGAAAAPAAGDGSGAGAGGTAQQQQPASSRSWILRSVLPERYRIPEIIRPAAAPTHEAEAAYTALYTFVITLILLSGGTLAEATLERQLRRMNADTSTPVDRTDRVLLRMAREGYIVKVRDASSGEELVEYMVGPRGRAEVGERGVRGLVRAVYGVQSQANMDQLEKQIERSLRISAVRTQTAAAAAAGAGGAGAGLGGAGAGDDGLGASGTPRPRGRPRKNPMAGGAGDEDEYNE